MRAVKRLDKSEYDFFGFYAGGASHKIMGQFLGLENGSSRNKSSQILSKLNISSRDDAFIVLHLSELLEPVMKNVRDIITGMLTDCYKIDDIFTIAFYWKMENNSFSFFRRG
jgi:hypothetical protein